MPPVPPLDPPLAHCGIMPSLTVIIHQLSLKLFLSLSDKVLTLMKLDMNDELTLADIAL